MGNEDEDEGNGSPDVLIFPQSMAFMITQICSGEMNQEIQKCFVEPPFINRHNRKGCHPSTRCMIGAADLCTRCVGWGVFPLFKKIRESPSPLRAIGKIPPLRLNFFYSRKAKKIYISYQPFGKSIPRFFFFFFFGSKSAFCNHTSNHVRWLSSA